MPYAALNFLPNIVNILIALVAIILLVRIGKLQAEISRLKTKEGELVDAREILEEAGGQANRIISQALEVKDSLNKKFEDALLEVVGGAQTRTSEFIAKAIADSKDEMEKRTREALRRIDMEVEKYKKERIEEIEEKARKAIGPIILSALGRELTMKDQEKLIKDALLEALR